MKTIGIISEYNPFHNGHRYHIQASKEACGADFAVCVMSGSFVQRGEPALVDKWSRAEMALKGGADLVLELPFLYACQPAEIFAYGAAKMLNSLGIIDCLCFGSELGNTAALQTIAKLLYDEPEFMSNKIQKYLGEGMTYPRASSAALRDTLIQDTDIDVPDNVTDSPNNILGIEYIKSLMLLDSTIKPVAIKRIVSSYNDIEVTQPIASATAVRNEIARGGVDAKVRQAIPEESFKILEALRESGRTFVSLDRFEDILLYKLRSLSPETLKQYANIKEGIEFRIKKSADSAASIEELIGGIKTKRYTRTYIQRLLCHILLDVYQADLEASKRNENPSYIRVLGFNDKGKLLLGKIKKSCPYPIITKTASFESGNAFLNRMFQLDIRSTDIYSLGYKGPAGRQAREDFLHSPVYVKSE